MTPGLSISSITFSDGTTLSLGPVDIIIIVGPNNAGKTATLREVSQRLHHGNYPVQVVASISIQKRGSEQAVIDLLEATGRRVPTSEPSNPNYVALGQSLTDRDLRAAWRSTASPVGNVAPFFYHLLTTEDRLKAANPVPVISVVRDPPTHPLHYLQRSDELEKTISNQFRRVFGVDLVVHRNAGREVRLYIGDRPLPEPGQDRASYNYAVALERLPLLHTQGDGMRAFAGVLLYTSTGGESLLLIDEPEAFLHPPQARELGRLLVSDTRVDRQLIVATHSGDVLRGCLDAGRTNVRVARIRRDGGINRVKQLDNASIAALWSDPLLRYSNILDGLFHERVIVCESDSDARFYAAMTDVLFDGELRDRRKPDLMFAQCGGKDRLPLVVRALRALDVPVVAVADFDILSSEDTLHNLVTASGGDWPTIKADWLRVKAAVDARRPELTADEVKSGIAEILGTVAESYFPVGAKREIEKILIRSSAWFHAKTTGLATVPRGEATETCVHLLDTLAAIGIRVVRTGELESFARTEGGHGPAWVNQVLKRNLKADTELADARAFVKSFVA
jgi:hypothetical protein